MSRFVQIKRQRKRGAYWEPGVPRMCTRCGVQVSLGHQTRRRQAVVTAVLLDRTPTRTYKVPVAYCNEHIPEALVEDSIDEMIGEHEAFLASEGADHLYPHGAT